MSGGSTPFSPTTEKETVNKKNFDILNSLSLIEVMRGWDRVPMRDGEKSASFLCPWHNDHRPSLIVDKVVRKGATDLGFKCFACHEEGFGAVQLAARLMGLPAGKVPDEDRERVLKELATRSVGTLFVKRRCSMLNGTARNRCSSAESGRKKD